MANLYDALLRAIQPAGAAPHRGGGRGPQGTGPPGRRGREGPPPSAPPPPLPPGTSRVAAFNEPWQEQMAAYFRSHPGPGVLPLESPATPLASLDPSAAPAPTDLTPTAPDLSAFSEWLQALLGMRADSTPGAALGAAAGGYPGALLGPAFYQTQRAGTPHALPSGAALGFGGGPAGPSLTGPGNPGMTPSAARGAFPSPTRLA